MPSASLEAAAAERERAAGADGLAPVPVRDAFERLLAPVAANPEAHRLVPLDVRRAAFDSYEQSVAPGGKPGRDWKHDYARAAAEIPWDERPEGPASAARPEPLVPHDAVAAFARPAFSPLRVASNAGHADGRQVNYVRQIVSEADRALFARSFGSAVRWGDDKFASLAVACMQDGLLIHVPAGVRLDGPILIETRVAGTLGFSFPYVLVVLDDGAEATVIEDLSGAGFSCGIVEAIVGDHARLDYVAVQRAGSASTILMNRGAVCAADATCRFFVAEVGAALSRSVIATRLAGKGSSAEITGFFFNAGDQHVDLSSLVEHAVGPTASRTTIKSAATGRGQGRYLGNIRIDAHANGSDATLRDDALLLSKRAHIDSVPALEIASNDVKAFHGATVGSIDEDELFYAQTRGIERSEAERMIALGFFEPLVAAFPAEGLRAFLRSTLAEKAGGSSPAESA